MDFNSSQQPIPTKVKQYPIFHDSMVSEIRNLREITNQDIEGQIESWKSFETGLGKIGFSKMNTITYLASVSLHHASDILVRRADLTKVFEAIENSVPLIITQADKEPNAAILGRETKEQGSSKISGIEAALDGGFGSLVEGKVVGVFGFSSGSSLKISGLEKNSPSLTKKYSEVMRGVSGSVPSEDIIFIVLRIHKSVYPESLCKEEDFDEKTGEVNPFILRVYGKNRQTH